MALVVYRGPSAYRPDVVVRAVLIPARDSHNRKTGEMAQLHILHDSIPPHMAQKTGDDSAVCGACPLRPSLSGGCYVVTCQGPLSTWRATDGKPVASTGAVIRALVSSALRLGAYGDPAALPAHVVQWLAALVQRRVTGYTHGWRAAPHLRPFCMASTHTPCDTFEAQALGWRTFRARPAGAPLLVNEIACPFERVTCAECLLCRGTTLRGARSISIPVHGSRMTRALSTVHA